MDILCKTLEISRSTYYRLRNTNSTEDKDLKLIYKVFDESMKTYGHRRVAIALKQNYGIIMNRKKVAKLMRLHNISPEYHKKKKNYVKRKLEENKKPNLLDRHFAVNKPNQVWVTDVCELNCKGRNCKKGYLSVILDLYDRKLVSYKIHTSNDEELVISTLLTARLNRFEAQNVIIHSDQGAVYFSDKFQHLCRLYGFQQSMSRKGKPTDNSVVESFFSRYRAEIKCLPKAKNLEELKLQTFDWLWFYDKKRISLPKKINKMKIFNYDKAIEKAKEFEKLKLKKIKL